MIKKNHYKPAIVLGCHKAGLGIIRALGKKDIPVVGVYYNKMDMGFASKYIVAKYNSPNPAQNEKEFINFLINMSSKWGGGIIIPSDDPTLLAISKNRANLKSIYRISCCEWNIIKRLLNKKHTYNLTKEASIPVPKTIVPKNLDDALESAETIGYPCLLKPSLGHKYFSIFKKKMNVINNDTQLKEIYTISNNENIEMMVQELIPGDDTHGFNYNSYYIDGKPIIEFTAQKLRLSPPQIGFPRVIVSKLIPELKDLGRKILSTINYSGFSCMEFKKDKRNGLYKFLEINARQNLSTPLAVKCGINFPYITYLHELYDKIPEINQNFKEGIFWIDLEKDLIETIKSYKKEKCSWISYLKPHIGRNVYSVFSLSDPRPFLKRIFDTISFVKMA